MPVVAPAYRHMLLPGVPLRQFGGGHEAAGDVVSVA